MRDAIGSPRVRDLVLGPMPLRVMPGPCVRFARTVQSNASAEETALVASQDVALAAAILQLAYALRPKGGPDIQTVLDAIRSLGPGILKSLAEGGGWEPLDEATMNDLHIPAVHEHSRVVSERAAWALAASASTRPLAMQAGTAGFFHDLGKLVVMSKAADSCRRLGGWSDGGIPSADLLDREREAFGATHAEIGADLLALWGFPATVVEAVRLHHQEPASHEEASPVRRAVYDANRETNRRQSCED